MGAGNLSLSLGAEPALGLVTITQVRSTADREVTEALKQPDRSLSLLLLVVSKMLFVP